MSDGELTAFNRPPTRTSLGLAAATTDNAVIRANGTSGQTQNSGVIIDDSNNVTGIAALAVTGATVSNISDTRFVYSANGVMTGSAILTQQAGAIYVNLSTGQTLITISDNVSGSYGTLRIKGGSGKYNYQIGANDIADQCLTIGPSTATGGTIFTQAAIKLDGATGNVSFAGLVGIGTTAGTYALKVLTSGNNGLLLDNGSRQIYLGATGGEAAIGTLTNHDLTLVANGGVKATLSASDGKITIPGGIAFANETLANYDEGTWTPTVLGDGTAGSNSYSTQVGNYTRIGRLIACSFNIVMSAKDGAMAGNIAIGGLPYPSKGSASYISGGSLGFYSDVTLGAGYTQLLIRADSGLSYAYLGKGGTAVAGSNLAPGDIANTTVLRGTIIYEI